MTNLLGTFERVQNVRIKCKIFDFFIIVQAIAMQSILPDLIQCFIIIFTAHPLTSREQISVENFPLKEIASYKNHPTHF